MRRITIILMSIAALAIASSCNKNINPEPPGDGLVYKTIHLSASETLTNKAAFGEKEGTSYPILWSSEDKVIICVNNDPDLTQELSVTPTDGGKSAEFGARTLALPKSGEITIRVTTNTTIASGGTAATVKYKPNVGESQAPQPASCDPESIILFAKETYSSAAVVPDKIEMSFSHATAYGLLNISGIDLGGETVKFVELQAMSPDIRIAGDVTIDGNGVLSPGSHTSLTMRGISDLSNPIWFAIAPSQFNTASALAIHVVTSADRHFEKILDCSSNPLKFQAGRISKFGVNFSGIEPEARQVKTIRDLVLLKNALQNNDYAYWMNSNKEIKLANDINYNNEEVKGNATTLHEGVTFNGQNYAIKNADISATIFKIVKGTVKNLKIEGGTNSTYLFNTIEGSLDGLEISGLTSNASLINTISSTGTAENLSIEGGENSDYLFNTIEGSLDGLTISGLTSSKSLLNTIASTGTVKNLTVDNTSEYTCPWSGNNMGYVTLTNHGLIEDCEVAATINVGDPERGSFNFGVFSPKCIDGRFVRCKNNGTVTCSTTTTISTGCSLGGIVGVIESTQDNSVYILENCGNGENGSVSLTVNTSEGSRICCVGGVAGGNYKGGISDVTGRWLEESLPSHGVIYECYNEGNVELNYNCPNSLSKSDTKGSPGTAAGGVIGTTINDLSGCWNEGSVTATFGTSSSNAVIAPKIGGVVGDAHNKVIGCINKAKASISVSGRVRNYYTALYHGGGTYYLACIGGVCGAVGCGGYDPDGNVFDNDAAIANSTSAGSRIQDCDNYSTSIVTALTYNNNSTPQIGAVCGWTSATNSGCNDFANTGLTAVGGI